MPVPEDYIRRFSSSVFVLSSLCSNRYATEYGGLDIWWTGSRLANLPDHLPSIRNPIRGKAIVPYRYHFNTVTFGYTTAFWSFNQWELLLDWLALRGVNLPLAWVGYERTLIDTFSDIGLSDPEIEAFLSGPAFHPWNRFGNIQGSWGGPLPGQWFDDQFALQKQIVNRMVELGMTPVLPSFTGFVPQALAVHYPNASIVTGSQWAGFPSSLTDVSFLEPFDPLFTTLQKSFISRQQAAYGNISHIYTLDQYNENDPFSGDTTYLRNVASNTFASLRAADPEAIWLMQGWLFFERASFWTNERIEAYLGGVEGNDSMIILDLYSEAQPQWNRTQNYFGKQWVWCELHNFGSNMGMEGNLQELTNGPIAALNSPGNSMMGIGLTMEGQEGDEIVYDILLDQAWSPTPLDIPAFVRGWVSRRYQVTDLPEPAQKAWSILSTTVYNNRDPNSQATIKSVFELAPALTGLATGTGKHFLYLESLTRNLIIPGLQGHHLTIFSYDTNTTILPSLQFLVQAATENPDLLDVPEFRYDLVDISRQLLANRFLGGYLNLVDTFNSPSSSEAVLAAANPLIDLLNDLDSVLATNKNFLLSKWIRDARHWAHGNASYAAYLEYNARNQITLWGPDGEINDYASKQWAGLVKGYYLPRWQSFIDYLVGTKRNGTAYDPTQVRQIMIQIGKDWDQQTWGRDKSEPWGIRGDTFDMVQKILQKWA